MLQARTSLATAAAMLVVLALAGCASRGPPATGSAAGPASAAPAAQTPASALDTEHRWLQSWFKDTPVVVELRDGALAVEVPLGYCFDAGRAQVKPALAAVLDKVAQSLRRQSQAQLAVVAAPGDPRRADIALMRATQVRRHLRGRGVPDARLAVPSRSGSPVVELRMVLAPSPA